MRQILHALLKVAARNAGQLTLGLGGCAPPPPFFGSPKKGGEKSSPLAMSQGLLPATRYALPAHMPTHGVARVARTDPRAKALPPACSRQGQKTPRRPAHKKRTTTRTGSAWL